MYVAMTDFALFALRFILGFFFVVYRFAGYMIRRRKHPWLSTIRHHNLAAKLCSCG